VDDEREAVRPPRRPGPANARQWLVTFDTRFGIALTVLFAPLLAFAVLVDGAPGRAAGVLAFLCGLLGGGALLRAALHGLRPRR